MNGRLIEAKRVSDLPTVINDDQHHSMLSLHLQDIPEQHNLSDCGVEFFGILHLLKLSVVSLVFCTLTV